MSVIKVLNNASTQRTRLYKNHSFEKKSETEVKMIKILYYTIVELL